MTPIPFADIHCHPNLKPFGHSFGTGDIPDPRTDVWFQQPLTKARLRIKNTLGISAYSQTDFTSMAAGGVKLAIVSLYPFEKGFFINRLGKGKLSANGSNMVTGIGYNRIRHLQQHLNYFEDLEKEYTFFCQSERSKLVGGQHYEWSFLSSADDLREVTGRPNKTGVVYSIEGAHVFNTGLGEYGRKSDAREIMDNIRKVKSWKYPPVFITFAHNFYNELCGHSRSLESLGPIVDQNVGLDSGFTDLGVKVLHELLDHSSARPVLIDIKHMSRKSRQNYYQILRDEYGQSKRIPIIVSHGGVTGVSFNGNELIRGAATKFYKRDINFYDEELVNIASSGGLFAIQLDTRRLASRKCLREAVSASRNKGVGLAAWLVWAQITHVAEVADNAFLPAWDTLCIGSDFDGTINPPIGCLSARDYTTLGADLLKLAEAYCLERKGRWHLPENDRVSPEEIIRKFAWENAADFVAAYFTR